MRVTFALLNRSQYLYRVNECMISDPRGSLLSRAYARTFGKDQSTRSNTQKNVKKKKKKEKQIENEIASRDDVRLNATSNRITFYAQKDRLNARLQRKNLIQYAIGNRSITQVVSILATFSTRTFSFLKGSFFLSVVLYIKLKFLRCNNAL